MRPSLSFIASTTASTAWRYALAFFLVVVAIGLAYLLVKAAKALASVDKMVSDLDREIVPLMGKVGTTVDEVNAELDKVNEITSSVVDMTQKIDSTTRAVESALATPAKKAAAFSSGVQQAVNSMVQRFRGGAEPAGNGAGPERVYTPPVYYQPPTEEPVTVVAPDATPAPVAAEQTDPAAAQTDPAVTPAEEGER
jgi:uncharacterized protein YoxC